MLRVGLDVYADIGVKSWKYIVQESTTDYGDVHGLKSDFTRDIRGSIIPKYYYIHIVPCRNFYYSIFGRTRRYR